MQAAVDFSRVRADAIGSGINEAVLGGRPSSELVAAYRAAGSRAVPAFLAINGLWYPLPMSEPQSFETVGGQITHSARITTIHDRSAIKVYPST